MGLTTVYSAQLCLIEQSRYLKFQEKKTFGNKIWPCPKNRDLDLKNCIQERLIWHLMELNQYHQYLPWVCLFLQLFILKRLFTLIAIASKFSMIV